MSIPMPKQTETVPSPKSSIIKAKWWLHGRTLYQIETETLPPSMQASYSQMAYAVKGPNSLTLLLKVDGKPAGFILGMPLESPRCLYDPRIDPPNFYGDGNTIYLQTIAILPEYRNNGNMMNLVRHLTETYRKQGFIHCSSHMRRSNGMSAFAARKLSFVRLASYENWKGTGETFDYMLLEDVRRCFDRW